MTFEMVDKLFRIEFKLSRKESYKNGKTYYTYYYEDRHAHTKRRNVVIEVRELLNGGVAGYVFVDLLNEYRNHPQKTALGHYKVSRLKMEELRELLAKVTKEYK